MGSRTIKNKMISLSVDAKGRITSLKNRITGTELISYPKAAEVWRMIVPTGRHTIDMIYGSDQVPKKIEVTEENEKQQLVISYDAIKGSKTIVLKARFVFELANNAEEISAWVELDNKSDMKIDEVEFPIVGGVGDFYGKGKKSVLNLVAGDDKGRFCNDVLHCGLPETGRECDHYCREHETSFFRSFNGVWVDLWSEKEGLYFGFHTRNKYDFVFKAEKFPKEVPNKFHFYPEGTPRWLKIYGIHVPRVPAGKQWISERVTLMPHKGDWHNGADRYSSYRHETVKISKPPAWMDDFVGWSEILGKTYLGEVFHDYKKCADEVIQDKKVTGVDLVFYYGHTKIGAEGADFDWGPSPDLGGERGFRDMVERLHRNGCRILLLDHIHRYVNKAVLEYESLDLEKEAIFNKDGIPLESFWWKETVLSCWHRDGPTPAWIEICPCSKKYQEYYIEHVTKMIELGVDGLELDLFNASCCYNPDHGHGVGENMFPAKMEFMRTVRSHAKALNPDFILIGETSNPDTREVLDGFYCRFRNGENDRIFRYIFPELRQQAALAGNYAYDQVNKALMLCIGVDTEIWGLRKITRTGCPELARYIGEVNRFKRKYGDILIRGTFRDTIGGSVKGDILYSVINGSAGTNALVLRNASDKPVKGNASLKNVKGKRLVFWKPFLRERNVKKLPVSVILKPYEAAVLLAL